MESQFPAGAAVLRPQLEPQGYGQGLAFSPDGKQLAATYNERGGNKSVLYRWDLSQPSAPRELVREPLGVNDGRDLAFGPDGSLAVGGYSQVWVYPPGGGARQKIDLGWYVSMKALAFGPGGKWLLAAPSCYLCECHLGDSKKRDDWEARHQSDIACLAFSPDGKYLASGAYHRPYLHLWDAQQKLQLKRLTGHKGGVWTAAFSPDGTLLASGGFDRVVTLREVSKTWKVRHNLAGHTQPVHKLAFSPDGKLLVSAASYLEKSDGLRFWDPATGAALGHLTWPGSCPVSLAFSPDGKHLAVLDWTSGTALLESASLPLSK